MNGMSHKSFTEKREDHEPPAAIAKYGWRFHHIGIPTDVSRPDEQYLKHLKMYVSGFETSPYGIEWMRGLPHLRTCANRAPYCLRGG